MPSILQVEPMVYAEVAETVLLGGTSIQPVSDQLFWTTSGDYTLRFTGDGFAYDGGTLTAGEVEEIRVYRGGTAIEDQQIIIGSNFVLLDHSELAEAFALAAAGLYWQAVALITASWEAEYFSHTNYSGGAMHGYGGDDFISTGAPASVEGRGGDDSILLGGGADRAFGGEGSDRIYGGGGADLGFGEAGDDSLYGGTGADALYGGTGDDALEGDRGDDTLDGGDGDDALFGGHENDRLYGGAGADRVESASGYNLLDGGEGADTINGGLHSDTIFGGGGDDTIGARNGDDLVEGGTGQDTVYGHAGADTLGGGGGHDRLYGGTEADVLRGGAGNDFLFGGAGADLLIGGPGNDRLTGNEGADRFVFVGSPGHQIVTDFEDGVDRLDLGRLDLGDVEDALNAGRDIATGVRFVVGDTMITVLGMTLETIADELIV